MTCSFVGSRAKAGRHPMRAACATAAVLAALAAGCASPGKPSQDASAAGMSGKPEPQMQAVLDALQSLGARSVATLTPAQARRQPTPADAVRRVLDRQGQPTDPVPVGKVEDIRIMGAAGPLPARVYWPKDAPSGQPLPVIHYLHGGGWVIADLDTYDATPRALANAAQAIVVSTHYRQAPEHPFPAAHDDAWAGWRWVTANAARLGGDPRRVAVAGESAGGNMAASIALRARDERVQQPVHQLLVYPVADARTDSPSEQANAKARPLDTAGLSWFYSSYLRQPTDATSTRFTILGADLRGVAPATVITAQIDPLRAEGEAYAQRLAQAGVPVTYRNFDGVTHEFFGMGAVVPQARQAMAVAAADLRQAFAQPGAAAASAPARGASAMGDPGMPRQGMWDPGIAPSGAATPAAPPSGGRG